MKKITIFTCYTDENCYQLKNKLYSYIRAGNVGTHLKNNCLCDNTGNNISNKNKFYNELTVQYWAWKNINADYYGLCHYRRFISFSSNHYKISTGEHDLGLVKVPCLSKKIIEEHNLENDQLIADEVSKYDLICMEPISVRKYFPKRNMYETYASMPLWHNINDIDNALKIIRKLYPEIYSFAYDYFFKSKKCYYYNCWIMTKELLNKFSKFQFDVLFELEKEMDYSHYSKQKIRALGLIGERLFGAYLMYIESLNKYKINHRQVLFVEHPNVGVKPIPFSKSKNIPIVAICNNFYVPYFSALLASLAKHNSKYNFYDFIIITKDITKTNLDMLKTIIKPYKNISLRTYNPIQEISDIKFYNNSNSVTENTYYRIFTPWILSNYKKAIVLDADLVFNEDPAKLFNTELGNNYIAAAKDIVFMSWINGMDISFKKYAYEYMGMKDPYNYVNTGVMVMNLELIRKDFSLDEFIKLNTQKPYRIREQDSMNVVFERKIKFLPINWNFYIPVNGFLKKCMPHAPVEDYNNFLEAEENPYILHWASYPKPWIDPSLDYAYIWWGYLKKTPFYEICLKRYITSKTPSDASFLRKLANKIAPPFTKRRIVLKKLIWRSTSKKTLLGKIYYKIAK